MLKSLTAYLERLISQLYEKIRKVEKNLINFKKIKYTSQFIILIKD